MDEVPQKKSVSVNLSNTVFSMLDFFTLEDGTNYEFMPSNISKESRSHMTIWRCRPWFVSAWYG